MRLIFNLSFCLFTFGFGSREIHLDYLPVTKIIDHLRLQYGIVLCSYKKNCARSKGID